MQVLTATGGVASTNAFLVVDEATKQCVLFDAPDHTVGPLLEHVRANDLNLVGLWLTHGHFDHIADHQAVRDAFPGVKVLIHPLDEPKLQQPNTKYFQLPFTISPGKADGLVNDGDVLRFGEIACRVLHTPGHSPGHVCYYFEADGLLIGGDLIIGNAVGRYDLPDSSIHDVVTSVLKVMALPPATKLLGGHGGPSTLAEESARNPYVRQIQENGRP